MVAQSKYRFDPVDRQQLRLLADTPMEYRVRIMQDARELAVALIRGRLQERHPQMSLSEINLLLLKELDRNAQRSYPRF